VLVGIEGCSTAHADSSSLLFVVAVSDATSEQKDASLEDIAVVEF
jgi:hypothetical protein